MGSDFDSVAVFSGEGIMVQIMGRLDSDRPATDVPSFSGQMNKCDMDLEPDEFLRIIKIAFLLRSS